MLIGPKSRAPLGAKTTNAKAKAFQAPAPPAADNDLGKTNQKSASARKAKPRVSHAEMTKLEVLGDKDELEEREVEYMPPRSKGSISRRESIGRPLIILQICQTCQMIMSSSIFPCSRTGAL